MNKHRQTNQPSGFVRKALERAGDVAQQVEGLPCVDKALDKVFNTS